MVVDFLKIIAVFLLDTVHQELQFIASADAFATAHIPGLAPLEQGLESPQE